MNKISFFSRKSIARLGIFLLFVCTLGVIWSTSPKANAVSSSIDNKSIYYSVAQCYNKSAMQTSVVLKEYPGYTGLVQYNHQISRPYGTFGKSGQGAIRCRDAYNKVLSITSNSMGSQASDFGSKTGSVRHLLLGTGYKRTDKGNDSKQCATFNYGVEQQHTIFSTGSTTKTSLEDSWMKVCASGVDSNGVITSNNISVETGGGEAYAHFVVSKSLRTIKACTIQTAKCTSEIKYTAGQTKLSDLAHDLFRAMSTPGSKLDSGAITVRTDGSELSKNYKLKGSEPSIDDLNNNDDDSVYTLQNNQGLTAAAYFANTSNPEDLKLTASERADFLMQVLRDYYGVSGSAEQCDVHGDKLASILAETGDNKYYEVNLRKNGKVTTCFVRPTKHKNDTVNGYNTSSGPRQYYPDGSPMSFELVISELNKAIGKADEDDREKCREELEAKRDEYRNLANDASVTQDSDLRQKYKDSADEIDQMLNSGEYYSEQNGEIVCASYTDPAGNIVTPGEDNSSTSNSSSSDADEQDITQCLQNASSLGWFLCPMLNTMGKALNNLYENLAEQFLSTPASEQYSDSGSIHQAWGTFRNAANLVFAIILTIVILSQITGFGISNYGIKKILPNLIVIIILVNISFFLCQIAIDVSNIVGVGVNTFFTDVVGDGRGFATVGSQTLTAVLAATGVGIAGVTASVAFGGLALLGPVLIAILGAIIGVFFMLLILALRQAVIAVLVAISPLAVVCYALPNTKSLFDKWKKMLVGMLMVYPISAAIIGGTAFASQLIATKDAAPGESIGVMAGIIALVLQVAPFFLIPTVVKSSMNVIGNAGALLSRAGQQLKGWSAGKIRNSDFIKDGQERAAANAAGRRAGLFNFGQAVGLPATAGARRRAVRNFNRYRKHHLGDAEAEYAAQGMTEESIQNAAESLKRKYDDQRIDDIANKVINGNGSYINADGNMVSIDQNNVENVGEAYASAVARAAADPSDQRAFDEAAGLQKVLMMQKDKGLQQIERGLKAQTHNDDGTVIGKNEVASALAAQMGRDGRWMGDVKTFDPGTFKYFNDLSNKSAPLQDGVTYASTTAENFKPAKLPDLGDGAFESIKTYANDRGKLDVQSAYEKAGNVKSLWGAADSIEKAYSDPRIASQIKPDAATLKLHNDIRRSAYNAKVRAYAQMQGKKASEVQHEFINKFGAFHEARPGEAIQRDKFDTASYLAHNANMYIPH